MTNWRQTLTCKRPVFRNQTEECRLAWLPLVIEFLTLNKLSLVWYFIGNRIQNADGIDVLSHSAKRLSLSAQTVKRKLGFWSLNIRSTCWAVVLLEIPGLLQKFTRHKSEFRRGDVIEFRQKRWETFWTNLLSDEITVSYLDFCQNCPSAFMD